MLFPTVSFAAFQPDLVYLLDAENGNNALIGPLASLSLGAGGLRLPRWPVGQ